MTVGLSAMYGRNFMPKIFTDITTPAKQSYSPNNGKKSVINHIASFHRQTPSINTTKENNNLK